MKSPTRRETVRRSVALPSDLVEHAIEVAPPELKSNFNRIVRTALQGFITARRKADFAEAMAQMASDPDIINENEQISREFTVTDGDGLGAAGDPAR